jgi:hypothetical protein
VRKVMKMKDESGFTLAEVAMASLITAVGLIFLASLFVLAMGQNRGIKQYTAAELLCQKKIEELEAVGRNDCRLTVAGGLTEATKQTIPACPPMFPDPIPYFDVVFVDDVNGIITTVIPAGSTPTYHRYWQVEPDPGGMTNVRIISVRVVADQPGSSRAAEETTLTTSRSW